MASLTKIVKLENSRKFVNCMELDLMTSYKLKRYFYGQPQEKIAEYLPHNEKICASLGTLSCFQN